MVSRLGRDPAFLNVLRDWRILSSEIPKGFEKYFGKSPKPQPKSGDGKTDNKGKIAVLKQKEKRFRFWEKTRGLAQS